MDGFTHFPFGKFVAIVERKRRPQRQHAARFVHDDAVVIVRTVNERHHLCVRLAKSRSPRDGQTNGLDSSNLSRLNHHALVSAHADHTAGFTGLEIANLEPCRPYWRLANEPGIVRHYGQVMQRMHEYDFSRDLERTGKGDTDVAFCDRHGRAIDDDETPPRVDDDASPAKGPAGNT